MRPAVGMLSNQGFDNGGYLPLLTARKLGRFLENPTHLADRPCAALLHLAISNQGIKRDAKSIGQLLNLIRPQGDWSSLPPGVSRLRDAHPFSKLLL